MSVEPDRLSAGREDDAAIAAALSALPLVTPASDVWPDLVVRLKRRNRPAPSRWMGRFGDWPLAVAATVLLAVIAVVAVVANLPVMRSGQMAARAAADTPGTIAAGAPEADLVARSQWLERLVESPALAPVVLDGDQALLEQGLRARLLRIDAALVDDPEQARLWHARVSTLGDLAELRWAGRRAGLVSTAGIASEHARLQWIQ